MLDLGFAMRVARATSQPPTEAGAMHALIPGPREAETPWWIGRREAPIPPLGFGSARHHGADQVRQFGRHRDELPPRERAEEFWYGLREALKRPQSPYDLVEKRGIIG